MDQETLRSVWQEQSEKTFGQGVQWQESHPNATLAEIEKTVHQHLMKRRAQLIQEVALCSADQSASQGEQCPHCQTRMHARGRRKRSFQTQGGHYVELERSYYTCPTCGYGFFPLDKRLDLPALSLLPHAHRSLTRLAALLPFEQAKASLDELLEVHVSASLARRACLQAGRASLQVQNEQANPQAKVPEEPVAERMVMSTDGAFVALTSGEWAEVKLLSLGEVDPQAQKEEEIQTTKISSFARLEEASVFSDQVSGEIRRRGIERAPAVCAVQDGALWLQQVVQDHRQDAIRILDFAHAAEYISAIGEAVQARGWHLPANWLQRVLHRLKHDGPDRVLEHLHWLCKRLNDPKINKKERYLSRRREQMRYPVFRKAGWPIGSGMVESGHKVVMQSRLKGAGMRWERNNVNPMLALRMALCNDRWLENWQQQGAEQRTTREQQRWHHQQQRVLKRQEHAKEIRAQVAPPLPPPSVPIEPEKKKKGRTESQKQWGRRTFSTRVLRQGS